MNRYWRGRGGKKREGKEEEKAIGVTLLHGLNEDVADCGLEMKASGRQNHTQIRQTAVDWEQRGRVFSIKDCIEITSEKKTIKKAWGREGEKSCGITAAHLYTFCNNSSFQVPLLKQRVGTENKLKLHNRPQKTNETKKIWKKLTKQKTIRLEYNDT